MIYTCHILRLRHTVNERTVTSYWNAFLFKGCMSQEVFKGINHLRGQIQDSPHEGAPTQGDTSIQFCQKLHEIEKILGDRAHMLGRRLDPPPIYMLVKLNPPGCWRAADALSVGFSGVGNCGNPLFTYKGTE